MAPKNATDGPRRQYFRFPPAAPNRNIAGSPTSKYSAADLNRTRIPASRMTRAPHANRKLLVIDSW